MHENALVPGRAYNLKIGSLITGQLCSAKYKINTETNEHTATKNLELNELGM